MKKPNQSLKEKISDSKFFMKVSIIAVNWNGGKILDNFIENLLDIDYNDKEIIIVDNGSTDDSLKILSGCDNITVIPLKKNLGFAGGNNYGIKNCSGDFILLVNTDVLCPPDIIKKFLSFYNSQSEEKKIGALVPVIKLPDGKINSLGSVLYKDFQPYNIGFNQEPDKIQELIKTAKMTGFYGACVLLNKKMIDDVGLMNEEYFLYHEETDLAIRGLARGWKFEIVLDIEVKHFHSYSSGELSFKKIFYSERNRLFNLIKYGLPDEIFFSPYYTLKRYFKTLFNKKLLHYTKQKKNFISKLTPPLAAISAYIALFFYIDALLYFRFKNITPDRNYLKTFDNIF